MKVVIQRVKSASVTVDNAIVSEIKKGLCLLVGISTDDTTDDVSKLASKILKLKLFEDTDQSAGTNTEWVGKPWMKSIVDINGEILSVSQFTLYANIKKGAKPDFHKAQKGQHAIELYNDFLSQLKSGMNNENSVKDGQFGAMMDVALVNDGPVTIVWDTKEK
ncbi:D-tyrosyl-tRNA(Tyr) deacylase [Pichia californica]|uniref:D-aminoacyl-tRNA deacylase n=1 Tax=Pichia californica TaxID=460514 RepID=A0A9P6WIP4_9ASCO|nr:D-tyrosyl-tRNA(Tyr) deacylase [[Candida] californica]KAG0687820.1 D-tyrosyl-tRNA(Tyr) deacylase [[Candida] californica]